MNDFDTTREDPEEKDELWQLLGKAKTNAGSPLFSRNVLREVRNSRQSPRQETGGLFSWLRKRWHLASACALVAALLGVTASQFIAHKGHAPQVAQSANEVSKAEDTEVVAHLDELVAYEENSIWLEDSSN